MKYVICVICLFAIFQLGVKRYKYSRKVNAIFKAGEEIPLTKLILFSYDDIVSNIKDCFWSKKSSKTIKVNYAEDKFVEFTGCDTGDSIMQKLSQIKGQLLREIGNNKCNFYITDSIDEKILKIWLINGHNKHYRKIYSKEINKMFEEGKISTSTFNTMYKKFYWFEEA